LKVIVVGALGVTRELAHRLGPIWDVTVVDTDPSRLDGARRAGATATVQGDGSSRVILERAGLAEADAVVAATPDDDVNLEVCRLARLAGCWRVVGLAVAPERLADFRRMGVDAHAMALSARDLEALLDRDAVSTTTLAAGRSEAVEFRIGTGSPVKGMTLRELRGVPWLVVSILRQDRLIVPHGDSVLEEGDVVTVVGAAADYPRIVRTFLATEARFPLEWGRGVAVALDGGSDVPVVSEALELARATGGAAALVVHRSIEAASDDAHAIELAAALEAVEEQAEHVEVGWYGVPGRPARSLAAVVRDRSVGVVVLPAPRPGFLGLLRAGRALQQCIRLGRPVLFAGGAHPYGRIVAAAETEGSGRIGSVISDLAAGARLPVVTAAGSLLGNTGERASGQAGTPADLLILRWPTGSSAWPGLRRMARLLIRRGCSVLLIPDL
jgi:Trk K+ transport system NAD-binding subunit